MLKKIKTLLNIQDDLQDAVLDILIENVTSHLKALLGKEVPTELQFIIVEIVIRRYNRLGAEGMKSETVEGHKTDFYDLKDEFVPYQDIIEAHKESNGPEPTGRGKVLFI
ncbi:phage head-tail connector protein [Ornithinibacillus sp. JPR2-1]|uniref:phage head-tail connector protein n=1 Tax=Ornithinibacillus sp. JPR2-1 TaxID=2094019 RepID=UPI0031E29BFC